MEETLRASPAGGRACPCQVSTAQERRKGGHLPLPCVLRFLVGVVLGLPMLLAFRRHP